MPKYIELDINKRWEEGFNHHPKSVELFESIRQIDYELCGDYFCWKSGGDGDNGETFMYQLDIHFERLEQEQEMSDIELNNGAIIKFNNGNGALLCNDCHTIIAYGFDHKDQIHLCGACKLKGELNDRS